MAIILALFTWLILIPIAHGVVPWAISTLMPHYGWEGGAPGFLNRLGLVLVMHAFVVFYEEPVLRKQFGATYEEYCRNVHRWLPRWPRPTQSHGSQTVR